MGDKAKRFRNRLHVIVLNFFSGPVEVLGPLNLGLAGYLHIQHKGTSRTYVQLTGPWKRCKLICRIVVHYVCGRKGPTAGGTSENVIYEFSLALRLICGENLLEIESAAVKLEILSVEQNESCISY